MLGDIRYALRALRHHPSFTAVAVLSIALGIGANSVMFSLADAMLLRPLAVPQPDRLINLRGQLRGQAPSGMSYPDFQDFRNRSQALNGLAAYELSPLGFAPDRQTLPEMKAGFLVTDNFFDVLEVKPQVGRSFRRDENAVAGRDAVAVISHDLWKSQFNLSSDAIGRSVYLNGIEFEVIGVMPESFTGVDQYFRPAFYAPLMMSGKLTGGAGKNWMDDRTDRRLQVKARLAAGVSPARANAEAGLIASALAKAYPDSNSNWSSVVRTETQARLDMSPYDAMLVSLLLGLAAVVLVIACANVANLMLSRSQSRAGEIAIRMAIGAGRWRLVRQLLTESLILSLAAGWAGLFLAQLCMSTIMPWRIPSEIPIDINATVDFRGLVYGLCAAVASAVVCGLLPALRATRFNIESTLRAGGRNLEPRRRFVGKNLLVIAQVAGSLFLMVCATQLYRGISYILTQPAGFRTSHVLMASFDPTLARYGEARVQSFYRELLERARAMPGVTSVSLAELAPMANHDDEQAIAPEGFRPPSGSESVMVYANVVGGDYFSTMSIPVLRGRGFRDGDTADSPRVAVVNGRFAQKYFPNQDPIGKRFRMAGKWVEIVGEAKRSKYFMLVEPPLDAIYLPLAQNPRNQMTLEVQTAGPSELAAAPLRDLVRSIDAAQPMFAVRTIERYFHDRGTKTLALITAFVGGMGLLGLMLALSGIYAMMSWSVTRRLREIGVRMAVGADRIAVMGMVLKQGVRLSAIGIAIGLLLSVAFEKALTAGIGTPAFNLPALALVAVVLLAMAAAGAFAPAHRASKLDPVTVLRQS